jgi:phosphoribosylglycinamide formyltransferase-1
MERPRIAILASGSGTTAEAFIRASVAGKIQPEATLVICNNKNAGIFKRIEALNEQLGLSIRTFYIGKGGYPPEPNETLAPGDQTRAEEAAIIKELEAGNFDVVALMGYMKKIGPKLIEQFGWQPEYKSPYQARMLNTHPGLLPETKGSYGVHIQEYVLQNHLSEAGQTLHVVAENYDEGPIIAEHRIPVLPDDTPESLV